MIRLKQLVLHAVIAMSVLYIFISIFQEWRGLFRMHYVGYDYAFFYYAFQAVLHHHTSWTSLYNLHLQQMFLRQHKFPLDPYNQYVYPPQFAWLFSWCALFPFWLSETLWMTTCGILYFLGIYWLMKTIWTRVRRIYLVGIFLIAAVLTPFQIDIAVGNVNSLLFAAISLGFYLLYYRDKPKLAGIPFGIAILLKVTPAAILLVLILRKKWTTCTTTIATAVIGSAVSSAFVGVSPIVQYLIHFSSFGHTSMKNGPAPYNQSVIGVLGLFHQHHLLHFPGFVQSYLYVIVSVIALGSMIRIVRRSRAGDWRLDIALASLTPLTFSPLVEEPHMVFVIPALVVFARIASEAIKNHSYIKRRTVFMLGAVTISSVVIQSLPVTFLLNYIVSQWPQWFFVHIQMFLILAISFITTLWLYNLTAKRIMPVRINKTN